MGSDNSQDEKQRETTIEFNSLQRIVWVALDEIVSMVC